MRLFKRIIIFIPLGDSFQTGGRMDQDTSNFLNDAQVLWSVGNLTAFEFHLETREGDSTVATQAAWPQKIKTRDYAALS